MVFNGCGNVLTPVFYLDSIYAKMQLKLQEKHQAEKEGTVLN